MEPIVDQDANTKKDVDDSSKMNNEEHVVEQDEENNTNADEPVSNDTGNTEKAADIFEDDADEKHESDNKQPLLGEKNEEEVNDDKVKEKKVEEQRNTTKEDNHSNENHEDDQGEAKVEEPKPESGRSCDPENGGAALDMFKTCTCYIGVSIALFLLFVSAINVTLMVVGIKNRGHCPAEPKIPMFLFVSGLTSQIFAWLIVVNAAILRYTALESRSFEGMLGCVMCLNCVFSTLLGIFCIAWFICGNVWVFSTHPSFHANHESLVEYCDKTTYLLAFWVIVGWYIIAGLGGVITCCCSTIVACCYRCCV